MKDGYPNFHRGTPNSWSVSVVDHERGMVFIPFGSANADYTGSHKKRMPVDVEYYSNSVVALDAATGEKRWHFQVVHHDLWDFDVASQPVLLDVIKDGVSIPAVAQATKMGHLFLLHRETGEPLYPVEERSVPQTDVEGEYTSETQPFPTFPEPLHPHTLSPDDAWGFTFYDRNDCQQQIEDARNEGIFTPPSERGSIGFPSVAGGSNWGGLAYDPERRWAVLNQSRVVTINRVIPKHKAQIAPEGAWDLEGTDAFIDSSLLLSPFGVPCIPPPWGTLTALNLETGKKVWEIPFGTTRDMVPGLSLLPFGLNFGLPSAGGPIITASGLVFIAASLDDYLRAYSIETGEELWRGRLPAGGQAVPITYRLGKDGKQFVVIAAGGHGAMRTTPGDYLIAFALSEH
jgi:quinoprotein glucose dehydrogenase